MCLQEGAYGKDVTSLTPFVGETAREFEARKQGQRSASGARQVGLSVQADSSGHFFVELTLEGRQVRMLVDTGASVVTLSYEDAQALVPRISKKDFTHKVQTANGIVEAAPVQIATIQVGDIVVREVEALILPPGRLRISLLGMTFLKRLSAFEISGGKLVLRQ
ncbi:retropepsin-like aspartic protease family protein [Microvirga arabica]|nr:TIGR02281 family clan AA aspartic protease [Microvirga arabica]